MAKLISKTYGEALYELASEQGRIDAMMEEAAAVREIFIQNPEFVSFLNHPKIAREDKIKVVQRVFEGRLSREMTGFLTLIITKDRFRELDGILDYFITQVKKAKNICIAEVRTAVELDAQQKSQIEERLLSTTGASRMEMHYRLDAGLIGGMVIRIGDRVVDSSIRTKLDTLQKELLNLPLS